MNYIARLRAAIGPRKVPLVYATAIVRDEAGRVLLQRRSDFGDAWWGLPGGVLEMGETITACCRRETLEETGLTVEPMRLVGIYSSPRYDVHYPNGDEAQQVTATFECRITGGALNPQLEEIAALEFCDPDVLPSLSTWYAAMLRDCLAGHEAACFDPPEFSQESETDNTFWALRVAFGHEPFIAAGAAAFIRDDEGRVLLHRRGDTGEWGLPAGSLDLGETLAATVVREAREETGLEVEPVRLTGIYSGYDITYPNGDQLHIFNNTFECRVIGGELRADGHESLEVRFFPPKQALTLSRRFQQRIADALANQTAAFVR